MGLLYHNGFDLETQEEVDEAHKVVVEQAEKSVSYTHLTLPTSDLV